MSENNGLQARLQRIENFQNEIVETLQAISAVIGQEEVQERVGAIKRDKMFAAVTEAVREGKLEAVDTVTESSFLVGKQTNADGSLVFPGRFQLFANALLEDVREDIIGKSVGDKVTMPDKSVVEIVEVYAPPAPKKDEPKKVVKPKKLPPKTNPPLSGVPN